MWVKFSLKTTMVVDFIDRPMVAGPPLPPEYFNLFIEFNDLPGWQKITTS